MRNLRIALAALAVMAVVPAAARAQVVTGKFQWANTGVAPTNSFAWWWRKTDGTYRHVMGGGAYRAGFQESTSGWSPAWQWPASAAPSAFGPAVDIYCVDFLHNAKTSSTGYNAYFTKLTAASFAGPYTTRSNDLTQYLKAAWLITKMNTFGTTLTADKVARAEIHAAIWWIMSGEPASVYGGSGSTSVASNYSASGMNSWVTQASANYTSVNGMEWTVVTDRSNGCAANLGQGFNVTDSCSQEFLTQNVVPEPATMILLGTGLLATLAVAGVFRRPEA